LASAENVYRRAAYELIDRSVGHERAWKKTDGGISVITGKRLAKFRAAKEALRLFVRVWTAESAAKGIRANMISPGPTETPILEGQFGSNIVGSEQAKDHIEGSVIHAMA